MAFKSRSSRERRKICAFPITLYCPWLKVVSRSTTLSVSASLKRVKSGLAVSLSNRRTAIIGRDLEVARVRKWYPAAKATPKSRVAVRAPATNKRREYFCPSAVGSAVAAAALAADGDWRDELVPAFGDCANKSRSCGIIVQRRSNLRHTEVQPTVKIDKRALAPYRSMQLFAANDLPCMLNQAFQNLGRLGLQADELAVPAQFAVLAIEFENSEAKQIRLHINARDCRINYSARQSKRPNSSDRSSGRFCCASTALRIFPLLIDRSGCIIPVSN